MQRGYGHFSDLRCVACFARQAVDAVRLANSDATSGAEQVRNILATLTEMDLAGFPPIIARDLHRAIRDIVGGDPYGEVKRTFNVAVLGALGRYRQTVEASDHPLRTAARLAIGGNMIDFGHRGDLTPDDVERSMDCALDAPLHGDLAALERSLRTASSVVYLVDNAGEIVFDRLLLEQLSDKTVTVVVKSGPILNDATAVDFAEAGLDCLPHVEMLPSGSDAPGTLLCDCSDALLARMDTADLIVAKGQANYETLHHLGPDDNVWFLLKAKCDVIGSKLAAPVGHMVVRHSGERSP